MAPMVDGTATRRRPLYDGRSHLLWSRDNPPPKACVDSAPVREIRTAVALPEATPHTLGESSRPFLLTSRMRPPPPRGAKDEEDAERTLVPEESEVVLPVELEDFSLLSLSAICMPTGISTASDRTPPSSPESVYLSAPSSPACSVSDLADTLASQPPRSPRTHEFDDPTSDWEREWLEATNSDSDRSEHTEVECEHAVHDGTGLLWEEDTPPDSTHAGTLSGHEHTRHLSPTSDREDGYAASSENEEDSVATLVARSGESIRKRRPRLSNSVVLIPRFAVKALQDVEFTASASGSAKGTRQ